MISTTTILPNVKGLNIHESALEYRRYGLCVIPIKDYSKLPAVSWKKYQTESPSVEELDKWFKPEQSYSYLRLAIVTGEISGVTVIDFDSEDAWNKCSELLGDESPTRDKNLPVIQTPRGRHIYLPYKKELRQTTGFLNIEKLDLRNDGGYVIAPPSINVENGLLTYRRIR